MEHQAEGTATPLTWREQFALRAEACLEELNLANKHLEEALREFIDKILDEGRAATRDKAAERIRAKLPEPQKTIDQVAREATKKGKGDHAGEE